MKRVLSLIMALAVMLSLVACGGGKVIPEDHTEVSYEQGCAALKLMDKFMDGKLSVGKLVDKMQPIYDKLEAESNRLHAILKKDPGDGETLMLSLNTGLVQVCINSFILGANGDQSYDCRELRNTLYESLNPTNE